MPAADANARLQERDEKERMRKRADLSFDRMFPMKIDEEGFRELGVTLDPRTKDRGIGRSNVHDPRVVGADGGQDPAKKKAMDRTESLVELFEMDESIDPRRAETPAMDRLGVVPYWKFGWPHAQVERATEETWNTYSESRWMEIVKPMDPFEEELAIQVRMMRNRIGSPETVQLSSEGVARELQKEGYDARVVAKKANEGDYLRTWSHSYVVVRRGNEEIIVEPNFAAQFQVARPTKRFKEIVDMIPLEFVGGMDRLLRVADFLATRASESLRASGLNVPPWRERDGMLSKWTSHDRLDSSRVCGKVF